MNKRVKTLAALLIATSWLNGCATALSDGGACPEPRDYSRQFLMRAAAELEILPAGSAIEQMLADYSVERAKLKACRLR